MTPRTRREALGLAGLALLALGWPATAAAATLRQLVYAARRWLKRHHVKGWATVTIISGEGPPPPAYLEPGYVGSWRRSDVLRAYVGPAFAVTWSAGDEIPSFSCPLDGMRLQLYVGEWTVGGKPALADPAVAAAVSPFDVLDSTGPDDFTGTATASAGGSGVAFLVQHDPDTSDSRNLVPNPSFETGTTGWAGINSAALTANSVSGVVSGAQSCQIAPNTAFADPNSGMLSSLLSLQAYTGESPVPARPHAFSAYLTTAATDLEARVYLEYYSGGTPLNGVLGTYTLLGAEPTRLVAAGSPTSAASHAIVSVQLRSVGAARNLTSADLVHVDAVQLTTPAATGYFDGSTGDDTTYDYAWTGTAHASASTRTASPDAVPAGPTLPDLDVLAHLGTEVAVSSTFAYEGVDGVGVDGDYYIDTRAGSLWGPKASGDWPDDPVVARLTLTDLAR